MSPTDPPRVLLLVPHCPWPTASGAHIRHAALVDCLVAEGARVTVACLEPSPESTPVPVLSAPPLPPTAPSIRERVARRFLPHDEDLRSQFFASAMARDWIRQVVAQTSPSHIVVGHAWWADVLPKSALPTLLDTNDLVTLNRQLWKYVERCLGPARPLDVAAVDESLLNAADKPVMQARRHEFHLYDRYDVTVAISAEEEALIAANTRRTRVALGPMTIKPIPELAASRRGPAAFVLGPNPFNLHGFVYLARKVLPEVFAIEPALELALVGSGAAALQPRSGVTLVGEVEDLTAIYAEAPFAVSPVRLGTGAQIKVIEAMAHGVAPIVFAEAAQRTGVVHEETGLVATSAEEFGAAMVRLWRDRSLAAELGANAHRVATERYEASALRSIVRDFLRLH